MRHATILVAILAFLPLASATAQRVVACLGHNDALA